LIGCSSDNPEGRVSLNGKVSINGVPIKEGTISFEPIGDQNIKTYSGASIINGQYSIPASKGVVPGHYLVRLYATEYVGMINPQEGNAPGNSIFKQLIPPKYNEKSEEKIIVSTEKKTFHFNLEVKEKYFK
jgi:hypothetical protein